MKRLRKTLFAVFATCAVATLYVFVITRGEILP